MVCESLAFFHLLVTIHIIIFCFSHCSARDTMSHDTWIRDSTGETLVSARGRFELGFFTPGGSEKRSVGKRYVGIWYYNLSPQTVVWVANRNNPLNQSVGVFAITDGNLTVLDTARNVYWSTDLATSSSSNLTVKLMDSGNLVLSEDKQSAVSLWQSFESPTDTFLPHMKMTKNLTLFSWRDKDDPGKGGFEFKVSEAYEDEFILYNMSSLYWKSGEPGDEKLAPVIRYLLSNFSMDAKPTDSKYSKLTIFKRSSDYNGTRLVIDFTGEIQHLNWDKERRHWNLLWLEPKDRCSVYDACGNFGNCNVENRMTCKCLPGFKPNVPEKWNSGDFLGGCTRITPLCGGAEDTFLSLKMMKLGISYSSSSVNTETSSSVNTETDCMMRCRQDCKCQAYSFEKAKNSSRRGDTSVSDASCRTWYTELNNLQKEYGGRNVYVRVALSDLEPSVRNCEPCGTTMIPYPLSTGPDCGDLNYSSFHCNNSIGLVSFLVPEYRVISIDPDNRKFVIDTPQAKSADNCNARNSRGTTLHLNQSLPFNVTNWCYAEAEPGSYTSQVSYRDRTYEVEIAWMPPILEPSCISLTDCKRLPHSTCIAPKDGRRRCLCDPNFKWNGITLNCTQEGEVHKPIQEEKPSGRKKQLSSWIVVATVIASIILLGCTVISVLIWRRKMTKRQENREADKINRTPHKLDSQKRIKELIDSGDFTKEDEKGIDVPFFSLESILAATDDFSDLNKLGQGGYGPVYKGKLPGGEEIAVKRLSSVSGQGIQEFKNEVVLIAKLQHRNLVRLRGYCVEGYERILLYEYMPNRSLDSFIFDQTQSLLLNWETRFHIILGIARGLLYLHQDSRLRIIHRDLKTSNVLLDAEMNPKISDFGLARIVAGKQTEESTTRVVGTYGYMSPEYALDGIFSVKSDVFSFGVVLLEIISGKKSTGFYQAKRPLSLLGYAWRLWTASNVLDLMDQSLEESCKEEQFIKCVNVGLLCVQEDPSDRPTMSNVITMLDSESPTLPPPKEPVFVTRRGFSSTASSSLPETQSEITISLQEGRLV